MVSEVHIRYDDDTFLWVNKYLQDMGYIKRNNNLKARVKQDNGPWWETIFKPRDTKKLPELEYKAGGGIHYFTFKGKKMWVVHKEGETLITGWERTPTLQEDIFICTSGSDTSIIKDFITSAIKHCVEKEAEGSIGIYELHRWGLGWTKVQSKKCRSLDSVILDEGVTQRVMDDLKLFEASEEWYKNMGIPYRRSYLLYGPPGTGKTSFTQAIAGAMGYNICYLNLSGDTIDDDGLSRALNDAPAKSIILLEDIDGIFVERTSVSGSHQGKSVSFSGLLNALDGVRSQEGRVLFMTTNFRDRLDPALMRPGRADTHVFLNNASHSQLKRLFLKFYPSEEEKATQFANSLPEFKLSMAKMQGHFLKYRAEPQQCLDNVQEILNDQAAVDEMTVQEWLERLNLTKYLANFQKLNVNTVTDLRFLQDEGIMIEKIKVTNFMERKRIMSMIANSDNITKADFAYQTVNQARMILSKCIKKQDMMSQLLECIKDRSITGFQLKDIINEYSSFDEIKAAIQDRVALSLNKIRESRLVVDDKKYQV